MKLTVSPVSASSASTVQRESAVDQRRRHDPVAKADLLDYAVLLCGLDDVPADRLAVGDRRSARPRLEVVAEREHVRVRADAWIAEEVPGATEPVACLEDGESLLGALGLKAARCPDSGQACPDDQHVEMISLHIS